MPFSTPPAALPASPATSPTPGASTRRTAQAGAQPHDAGGQRGISKRSVRSLERCELALLSHRPLMMRSLVGTRQADRASSRPRGAAKARRAVRARAGGYVWPRSHSLSAPRPPRRCGRIRLVVHGPLLAESGNEPLPPTPVGALVRSIFLPGRIHP